MIRILYNRTAMHSPNTNSSGLTLLTSYQGSSRQVRPVRFNCIVNTHVLRVWSCVVTPLGSIDSWIWAREFRDADGDRDEDILESDRWNESYERVAETATGLPDSRCVYVGGSRSGLHGIDVSGVSGPSCPVLSCNDQRVFYCAGLGWLSSYTNRLLRSTVQSNLVGRQRRATSDTHSGGEEK